MAAKYTPAQVFNATRAVGGAIIGPLGTNWTADADGQSAAATHFDNLMVQNSPAEQTLLALIMDSVRSAQQMQAMNALPTTNPKCFSKPIMAIDRHGNLTVTWKGFHPDEVDCTGQ
jgi:hypothetical protein